MLHEQTLDSLNAMRLFGMAKSFTDHLNHPATADMTHADFVGLIVQDEKTYRENVRLASLLRKAKLRFKDAALEAVNYRHPRGLAKTAFLPLADTRWIAHHRNVLLTGPTGIGKSWLACALGNAAARAGFSVLYWRCPRLWETLQQARGDGSHLRLLAKLAKANVLILDDFLISPLEEAERRDALEIIEDRYGAGATILTSQLPPKDWYTAIGDPTLADALCDRLFHNAYKFALNGKTIRPDLDGKGGDKE